MNSNSSRHKSTSIQFLRDSGYTAAGAPVLSKSKQSGHRVTTVGAPVDWPLVTADRYHHARVQICKVIGCGLGGSASEVGNLVSRSFPLSMDSLTLCNMNVLVIIICSCPGDVRVRVRCGSNYCKNNCHIYEDFRSQEFILPWLSDCVQRSASRLPE